MEDLLGFSVSEGAWQGQAGVALSWLRAGLIHKCKRDTETQRDTLGKAGTKR